MGSRSGPGGFRGATVAFALLVSACGQSDSNPAESTAPRLGETTTASPTSRPQTAITTSTTSPSTTTHSVPGTTTTTTTTTRPPRLETAVEIVGDEELVYDASADRCGPFDAPDLPVRAFRDADGMVQINFSGPSNRRMIGPDFDSLAKDCEVVLASDFDPDPSRHDFSEWMGSTFTFDGETVYALIHNEYHGDQGSTWYAWRDTGAEQGGNDWHYQSWNGSSYRDMTYDSGAERWVGPSPLCIIGRSWSHPDRSCQPARTWISPVAATVTVSGRARDADPNGGDGVLVSILKGTEILWSLTLENGDVAGQRFDLEVAVEVGDAIRFQVEARGNTNNDTTEINPEINIGPDPCSSGVRGGCQMMSITFGVSTDGGDTFTHAEPPGHLVATVPYRYEPNPGLLGVWQPSNIVKSPFDDYFYVLVESDINPTGGSWVQGTCVMRTRTLEDPKSWRAWDGDDFAMRFIDPYTETDFEPSDHLCHLVPVSEWGALSYNLTYNTFLERFVAVGHAVNAPVPGFYYALSEDLIHWTPTQLLMEAAFVQTTDGPYEAYPSLVDPDSPSRNFDVTGQDNYLYFSRFARESLEEVDLLRVPVRFIRCLVAADGAEDCDE